MRSALVLIDLLAQARATLYPLVSKSAHFHRVLGRRGGKWTASSVRDILTNPLFGGRVVWGRKASTDKTTSSGKKVGVRVRRDESEWIVVEAPDLRIVDEAVFQRVQERLGRQRQAFVRRPDGAIAGRLETSTTWVSNRRP